MWWGIPGNIAFSSVGVDLGSRLFSMHMKTKKMTPAAQGNSQSFRTSPADTYEIQSHSVLGDLPYRMFGQKHVCIRKSEHTLDAGRDTGSNAKWLIRRP